jgi:hypothetical protein
MASSPDQLSQQRTLMLSLLKAGVPSSEILLAKSAADLIAVGERHAVPLHAPAAPAPRPDAATAPASEAEYDSSPSYKFRRFTAPPSAYEPRGTAAAAAIERARSRRQQQQQRWTDRDPPTGGSDVGSPGSPGSSFSQSSFTTWAIASPARMSPDGSAASPEVGSPLSLYGAESPSSQ